jgi:hypothetical protein
MKKTFVIICVWLFCGIGQTFAEDIDPIIINNSFSNHEFLVDNPKGKFKIRFVKTWGKDNGDTANRPKSFFAKLKNVVNSILDASENPPFKVEIVREKSAKN